MERVFKMINEIDQFLTKLKTKEKWHKLLILDWEKRTKCNGKYETLKINKNQKMKGSDITRCD